MVLKPLNKGFQIVIVVVIIIIIIIIINLPFYLVTKLFIPSFIKNFDISPPELITVSSEQERKSCYTTFFPPLNLLYSKQILIIIPYFLQIGQCLLFGFTWIRWLAVYFQRVEIKGYIIFSLLELFSLNKGLFFQVLSQIWNTGINEDCHL